MVSETERLTAAATEWGRRRWPGCRIIREFVLGSRRVDLLFVAERDIIGMEIKSGTDTLARLEAQLAEYQRYMPEVWMAVAPRFVDDLPSGNAISIDSQGTIKQHWPTGGFKPTRDELVCSRMLELLWRDEAAAIAVRTDIVPVRVPKQFNRGKLLKLLSRLLTGNDIVAQVCLELRARSLVGAGSDSPIRAEQNKPA